MVCFSFYVVMFKKWDFNFCLETSPKNPAADNMNVNGSGMTAPFGR